MDKGVGSGGRIERQREEPAELVVEELKDASAVRDAIAGLGHNRLNERGFLDRSPGEQGRWLDHVQSEVIDAKGAALAIKQGDKVIGFVLADPDGVITQLRSIDEESTAPALEAALRKLREKGFEHPIVKLTEKSEDAREILLKKDFHGGESEDGKIMMKKE
ncbi:MAG TPA: hypothetical protein VMH91_01940 [Candidatus Paceibacterota bacterium]|nr:hypothetical protein [Candidatus Paceibacterota bacterium]